MKKLLALMLAVALTLSLAACSGEGNTPSPAPSTEPAATPEPEEAPEPADTLEPEETPEPADTPEPEETPEPGPTAIPVEIGSSIDNDNFLMTFGSMELLDGYTYDTSAISSTSLYVEDGYKLLVVKGHFENKGTRAISDSAFYMSALVNGTYEVDGFDVSLHFQRDKYFEIDAYTDLDYLLYISIPNKLAEQFETAEFTIGFNDDLSSTTTTRHSDGTMTVDADNLYVLSDSSTGISEGVDDVSGAAPNNDNAATISIGDTITTDDYEFTLKNVELTYELRPSNTNGVYASYPADSGKVYIHVAADVKNIMQRDIRIDELFTASALYDGKYSYNGFTVVEDGDRFDWVGSYVAATPLETCKAHSLVECPAEVDTSGNPILVTLELGNTKYEYALR